jgi:hypothetical protein
MVFIQDSGVDSAIDELLSQLDGVRFFSFYLVSANIFDFHPFISYLLFTFLHFLSFHH